MLKIIFAKERTVLHSLLIQNISTYSKLSQYARCPLTELSCTDAVHTITYTNNSIEIVKMKRAVYLSGSFLANYRDFLGSCFFFQFSTIINISQMKTDVICRAIKQHTHSFLGTPNCLILIIDLNTLFLSFNLKD